jgi:hypothetical protein
MVKVVRPAGATHVEDGCLRFPSGRGSRVRISLDPPAALRLRFDRGGEPVVFVIREGRRLSIP